MDQNKPKRFDPKGGKTVQMTLSCSLISTVKGCVLSVVILTNHIGLIPLIWFPEFNITIATIVQMFVQGFSTALAYRLVKAVKLHLMVRSELVFKGNTIFILSWLNFFLF